MEGSEADGEDEDCTYDRGPSFRGGSRHDSSFCRSENHSAQKAGEVG